jgi:hypothetical protein
MMQTERRAIRGWSAVNGPSWIRASSVTGKRYEMDTDRSPELELEVGLEAGP